MNDSFARTTRSASFVLTLSDAQIRWLLSYAKEEELRAKYPWYAESQRMGPGSWTVDDAVSAWVSSTVRSLMKRGLLDLADPFPPDDSGPAMHDCLKLTSVGSLMVEVLAEAGFTVDPNDVRSVHLHPDDRPIIDLGDRGEMCEVIDRRADRRDPADEPFLSPPYRGRLAPPGSAMFDPEPDDDLLDQTQ